MRCADINDEIIIIGLALFVFLILIGFSIYKFSIIYDIIIV